MGQVTAQIFDVSFKAWHQPHNKLVMMRFIVPISEPDPDNISGQCQEALQAHYDLSALDIFEFHVVPINAPIWVPAAPPVWAIPRRH